VGGDLRVVSISITFIFYGLGEIGINLVSIFMNYYKYYFVLQGITVGLTGVLFFFICESPFYTYKMQTLGDFYSVAKFIIFRNFDDKNERLKVIAKVQKLIGIDNLVGQSNTILVNDFDHYQGDNQEISRLTLPDSSEAYFILN
jgi:hypothetical protein